MHSSLQQAPNAISPRASASGLWSAKLGLSLLLRLRLADDEASIPRDRHEVEDDVEAFAVLVLPGCAELGPAGFVAIAGDVEDVVGRGLGGFGLLCMMSSPVRLSDGRPLRPFGKPHRSRHRARGHTFFSGDRLGGGRHVDTVTGRTTFRQSWPRGRRQRMGDHGRVPASRDPHRVGPPAMAT